MNIGSKLLMASALALSFAAPALAQEENTLLERNVYLFMNGKMVHMAATDKTHAMIMKQFKALKPGTMIYVSGGKLYMSADKKMDSSRRLSTEIFGKEMIPGSEY